MIKINLSDFGNKLAVLYSGGADSTLLYYLTIKSIKENYPNLHLDLLIVDRYNKPVEKATSLYYDIKQRFGDDISKLKIVSIPENTPGNLQVIAVVNQVKNQYDSILWGVNQYPTDASIRPQTAYTVNFDSFKTREILKLPFADYNKADIVKAFFDLGLEEILYKTHSCGTPDAVPCGKCFNCRERIWAFNQLGKHPNLGI